MPTDHADAPVHFYLSSLSEQKWNLMCAFLLTTVTQSDCMRYHSLPVSSNAQVIFLIKTDMMKYTKLI